MKIVIYTLLVHWIGDFFLQSNWMATNKSKNIEPLLAHVLTYSLCLLVLMCWVVDDLLLFVLINGALHFCIDFVTSRITSYFWAKEDKHNFFVVIGLDQFLHNVCLITTLSYFVK